ncbi:phosphogluconate dehydrogenase [Nocardioides sp. Soil777]|nr:phosphogluconate dehydrogenase [Nocardioides sp. Soil777]
MTVAIVGLGEVGRIYGTALHEAGHKVTGFDPYAVDPVEGVRVCDTLADAVADAEVVLVLTAAGAGRTVAEQAVGHLRRGAAYVDCTSSAPDAKRSLIELFAARPDVELADVAILGPVIQLRTATPLMAAGPAAQRVAGLMRGLGADVAVVDGNLGDAMAHKLLRSVFMKGLAAAVTEAVTAGRAVGFEEWIRDQIARELSGNGQSTIDRWLTGSVVHARRRGDEMEAAAAYLDDLGVDSTMAKATAHHLRVLDRQTR